MIPIILPVAHSSAPSRCPNCHRNENIKEVCRNCAYEYTEDGNGSSPLWDVVGMFAIVAIPVWFIFTILIWAMPPYGWNDPTLLAVLQYQAHWLWAMAHRIW